MVLFTISCIKVTFAFVSPHQTLDTVCSDLHSKGEIQWSNRGDTTNEQMFICSCLTTLGALAMCDVSRGRRGLGDV